MKTTLLSILLATATVPAVHAQGTAFTFQGRLNDGGSPATGSYDLRFTLHDSLAGVAQVAGPLTIAPVGVTNGLFTVSLDFGTGAFNGAARWVQIGVRTNGSAAAHTPLTPRQSVTAAPYSILAGNVTGNISDSQLSANIARLNGNQTFTGSATFSPTTGAPFGVGSATKVSNLNADLLDGLDSAAFWKLGGNAGTTPGANYIGASDNAQVRLHANGGFLMDDTTPGLFFGAARRQMINLWNAEYGIGVQDFTLYQRTDGQFAWFRRGTHANGSTDPGVGGTTLMTLDGNANLTFNGILIVDANNDGDGSVGSGIRLGGAGSGETIVSKRTSGGNQFGLDFFTAGASRMSILNNGRIGVRTQQPEYDMDVEGTLATRGSLLVNSKDRQDATYPELPGIVFGNYSSGEVITSQRGTNGPNRYGLDFYTGFSRRLSIASDGIFTQNTPLFLRTLGDRNHGLTYRSSFAGQSMDGPALFGFADGVLGTTAGGERAALSWGQNGDVTVARNLSTCTLTIRGGCDLAEPFQMSHADIAKGSLVIIDEENPGKLKQSAQAYDTRVAGIISGANGVNAGITLHQEGLLEGGQNVALSGRVYALADAASGAIKPGDLLTSSETPGHVMRVSDHTKAQGAIVGKAMSALKDGKGMVLVLVSLQ